MKIRTRLLILLLLVALSPLVAVSLVDHVSTHRLGRYLAGQAREVLIQNARLHLHEIVRGYGGVLDRDKRLLEFALRTQAREIERRLREGPPPSPQIFFSRDYDSPTNSPPMTLSTKHFRQNSQGQLNPIPVTYEEQVYFVVAGVDPQAIADDLACLSTMPKVYKDLYQSDPEMMYWQYTALESGFHSSYPGHGGYPDDYDPRVRKWYLDAKQADSLVWIPPMPDVSTRTVPLALAMPVRRPDGSFAGVTAIDVPLNKIFKELQLPENLRDQAKTMVVRLTQIGPTAGKALGVAFQKSYDKRVADWRAQIELEYLESSDQEQLAALMSEALAGISGVRQMPYKGRDSLWAYGAAETPTQPFPMVIVPRGYLLDSTSHYLLWLTNKWNGTGSTCTACCARR